MSEFLKDPLAKAVGPKPLRNFRVSWNNRHERRCHSNDGLETTPSSLPLKMLPFVRALWPIGKDLTLPSQPCVSQGEHSEFSGRRAFNC